MKCSHFQPYSSQGWLAGGSVLHPPATSPDESRGFRTEEGSTPSVLCYGHGDLEGQDFHLMDTAFQCVWEVKTDPEQVPTPATEEHARCDASVLPSAPLLSSHPALIQPLCTHEISSCTRAEPHPTARAPTPAWSASRAPPLGVGVGGSLRTRICHQEGTGELARRIRGLFISRDQYLAPCHSPQCKRLIYLFFIFRACNSCHKFNIF